VTAGFITRHVRSLVKAKMVALAVFGCVAAMVAVPVADVVSPVQAADAYGVGTGESSRFIRIGLDKSVVVNIPASARDVLVGNPEVVDAIVRTPDKAYLFAKKVGQTNIFFFDGDGRQILALDIEVAQDSAALQQLIRRVLPDTRIKVETIGDSVILTGSARNPGDAKQAFDLAARFTGDEAKVLNNITVSAKEQVMLRVRVVEVQRNVLKQLGVDMAGAVAKGGASFTYGLINPFTLGGVQPSSFLNGAVSAGGVDFDGVIRMLERDGLLHTLAEPTLTAISGESAKFLAGGEFPVPVAQDQDKVTVEFKPFGVGLGFTPVVLSEGRMSLRVSTEVSELSNEAAIVVGQPDSSSQINIPSLKVRRAETTVEMPSGGSLVMAGLIQEKMRQDINGTPALMHLPVLGALFRSRDYQRNETELVVIVTPFVVNPVSERQLNTPAKGLVPPTDLQTILFGKLNKNNDVRGRKPPSPYQGPVGFIID